MIEASKLADSTEVIVPASGPIPWLSMSLTSIAAQSTQPGRITVVDDGIDDPKLVFKMGHEIFGQRFQLLRNHGRGISAALNTGIRQSTADWIMRMDSDDICHPDRLRSQLQFLTTASTEVLGCGTQVRFISETGKVLDRSYLPVTWESTRDRLFSQTCFVHPTLLVRRNVLAQTPYRSAMDGAEDADLLLRLAERGQILNLNQPLLDYRVHPQQESFRVRARHTALRELACRAARARRLGNADPLDADSTLAESFVSWRMETPGYVRARTFLTAMRYLKTYLAHGDMKGIVRCAFLGLASTPLTPSSIYIVWQVYKKAGAALLEQKTPFRVLNEYSAER